MQLLFSCVNDIAGSGIEAELCWGDFCQRIKVVAFKGCRRLNLDSTVGSKTLLNNKINFIFVAITPEAQVRITTTIK